MTAKISLITPPTLSHRTAEETLALGYLAAVLRESGYEVLVIDAWLERLSAEEVVSRMAEFGDIKLVAMSCYRSNLDQAVGVLKSIRTQFGFIPSICGGYGPTFHDIDFLNAGFDVAVRGEAEHIITSLVDVLIKGGDGLADIPGISYLHQSDLVRVATATPVSELDLIKFPSRDTIEHALLQKDYVHMCTSRGCGAYCIFCSIFAFALDGSRHERWRQRSVENVLDEIEDLYHRYGVRHFKFVDDSFIEGERDARWARRFRDGLKLRGLGIRFRTQVRADVLTEEIVAPLAEAGWFSSSVGIENGSETALRRMLKTATPEHNQSALRLMEQYGVYVQMGMILFDPFTTMDELWENLRFLEGESWAVYKGIFTEMFAAEGTPFTRKLQRKNMLESDGKTQNYRYDIQDKSAKRVYAMLKTWHRSHSRVFDWVIDSITAPKVLPNVGYERVHRLCLELRRIDVWFFKLALVHVSKTDSAMSDSQVTDEAVYETVCRYVKIEQEIASIYSEFGLTYDGIINPFL